MCVLVLKAAQINHFRVFMEHLDAEVSFMLRSCSLVSEDVIVPVHTQQ